MLCIIGIIVAIVFLFLAFWSIDTDKFLLTIPFVLILIVSVALALDFFEPVSRSEYDNFKMEKEFLENCEPLSEFEEIALATKKLEKNEWLILKQEAIRKYGESYYLYIPDGFMNEEPIR